MSLIRYAAPWEEQLIEALGIKQFQDTFFLYIKM